MRRRKPRRPVPLTSLIDVIFLLLLFFMLTSTFSRFSEIELAAAGAASAQTQDAPPLFLQLGAEAIALNAQTLTLATLPEALTALRHASAEHQTVLVALQGDVSAQRLADLLAAVSALPWAQVTVLGAAT